MTRFLFALPVLAAALVASASAYAADRPYPVADFDRLVVEGPYRVHLVVGRATTARASGTRDGLDRVSIETNGTTLRIRPQRNVWGGSAGRDPGPVTIELTTRSLRSARLLGPATLDVDAARGLNVEFMVEGSGTLHAYNVAADTLTLGLLGGGLLEITGTAKILRGQFQGTGSVAGALLAVDAATVTTNTAGSVFLRVNGRAEITAYGLGTVTILGRPACVLSGSGASQVACGPNANGAPSDQRQPR
jgi:hypothetical protein